MRGWLAEQGLPLENMDAITTRSAERMERALGTGTPEAMAISSTTLRRRRRASWRLREPSST